MSKDGQSENDDRARKTYISIMLKTDFILVT